MNLDLPVRAPSLIPTIAHETYPGHHLEQAWKEADLVDGEGRLEASILLINTPESPISEGLADVGTAFASPLAERAELLVELFERAGHGGRGGCHRSPGGRGPRGRPRRTTRDAPCRPGERGDAPPRGRRIACRGVRLSPRDRSTLPRVGGQGPRVHRAPALANYAFVYADGAELLERWIQAAPAPQRVGRFGRLLHEQITPGRLLAELG